MSHAAVEGGVENTNGFVYDDKKNLVGFRHDGEVYDITGISGPEFKEVEDHLMKLRKNPLLAIKDELEALKDNPALTEALMDRAYRDLRKHKTVDVVTRQEVFDFLNTREGAAMSIHMLIRKKKPQATIADAEKILEECSAAEAERKRKGA